MNPKKKDIDRFLETYVPAPSIEEMETDSARVLRRLKSENRPASSGNSSSSSQGDSVIKVSRAWWQPVAAAVLIGIVAIGAYAIYRRGLLPAILPVQRVSPPQAVLSTAQRPAPSVKAAAETTQVATITPGSTKPVVARSREEILRGVAAQIAAAQSTDLGAARPKFAAASVRLVPMSPLVNNGFNCLGVDGLLGQRADVVISRIPGGPTAQRGRCVGDVVDPTMLVWLAYNASTSTPATPLSPITGMPDSVAALNLQINAVADNPERATKGELKLMLQSLLEDRFKARVRLETREVDGYVLTIAKSGIKFKEASGDAECRSSPRPLGVSGKCRVEALTQRMTLNLGGRPPIADKTGLTGIYDIKFELEEIQLGPAPPAGPRGGPQPPRQFSPPIPKALEEQLGLHLEPGKVSVEYVVVDHIEAPTEN
jgi:uncharacterized protein (TIGR03435 family)